MITSEKIKSLREKTGAGMMDCKKALVEVQGDLESAIDWLRKKGMPLMVLLLYYRMNQIFVF